jgi:hypothetical protein
MDLGGVDQKRDTSMMEMAEWLLEEILHSEDFDQANMQ